MADGKPQRASIERPEKTRVTLELSRKQLTIALRDAGYSIPEDARIEYRIVSHRDDTLRITWDERVFYESEGE